MCDSSAFFNASPILVNPALAVAIGLEESIVLGQLDYHLQWARRNGREKCYFEERWWFDRDYQEWQEKDFPFWSARTIERIFTSLHARGLITKRAKGSRGVTHRNWYAINYEALESHMNSTETCQNGAFETRQSGGLKDANMAGLEPESGQTRQIGGLKGAKSGDETRQSGVLKDAKSGALQNLIESRESGTEESMRNTHTREEEPPLADSATPESAPEPTHPAAIPDPEPPAKADASPDKPPKPRPKKANGDDAPGFEAFWRAWPANHSLQYPMYDRKTGRPQCLGWWKTHVRSDEASQVIQADVARRAQSLDWNKQGGQYIPLPLTYLHRWDDASIAEAVQYVAENGPAPPPVPYQQAAPLQNSHPTQRYLFASGPTLQERRAEIHAELEEMRSRGLIE